MGLTSYVRYLDSFARYRVEFEVQEGKVIGFVVQLEVEVEGIWRPVVRYDTAHGFCHRDRYKVDGTVVRHELLPDSDYNLAFTFASSDVKENWEKWVGDFGSTEHE